jgi:predicted HAD superfamily phosphohydrolase YqeG
VTLKNNKLKELAVVQYIVPMFADVKWQHDKRVPGSKNGYRPDLLGDFGNMVVIVDIDENGHRQYDESKEAERMKQLAMDLGDRPLVIIRFNPDSYVNTFTQQTVQSCWRKDTKGVFMVPDEQIVPWEHRLLTLRDTITYVSRYYQELETHTFRLFFE